MGSSECYPVFDTRLYLHCAPVVFDKRKVIFATLYFYPLHYEKKVMAHGP